jgi:ankyrin repeat protein
MLFWACDCEVGDLDVVKLLVDNGAQVNGRAFGKLSWGPTLMDNWSNLHIAAHMGNGDIVEYLLDKGADIGAKCTRGDRDLTPLHFAARKGHVDVVKALLAKGADATLKSKEGKTAIDLAKEKNHKVVVELLRKHVDKE